MTSPPPPPPPAGYDPPPGHAVPFPPVPPPGYATAPQYATPPGYGPPPAGQPGRFNRLTSRQRILLLLGGALTTVLLCCGGLAVIGANTAPPASRPIAGAGSEPPSVPSAPTSPVDRSPSPLSASTPPPPPSTPPPTPSPEVQVRTVTETERLRHGVRTVKDSSLAEGKRVVRTPGVDGVRTLTYQVTVTDGVQTGRKLVRSAVTRKPVTEVVAVGTKPARRCDPNYSGCVPIASDVDCAGGGGNGPAYVTGPVHVVGSDIYDLDRDNDGYGCDD
ncbi:G5 domain-containing protein [Micromonospora echinospora]|uniref:G5 domain-containing protein n=1 Tax=Micromonospora echinospora TaxID=1877 RepID=UPI003A843968